MYEWCSLHQSRAFNFAKIPSNLVRLDELGPSADTSAKRKSKQVLRLTAVWEIFAHWTSLKEMCKIKFHYFQKNSEPVDLQHKNEFLLYIFIEYTILLCKRRFATNSANQLESQQFHTPGYYIQRIDFRWNDSTLQCTYQRPSREVDRGEPPPGICTKTFANSTYPGHIFFGEKSYHYPSPREQNLKGLPNCDVIYCINFNKSLTINT